MAVHRRLFAANTRSLSTCFLMLTSPMSCCDQMCACREDVFRKLVHRVTTTCTCSLPLAVNLWQPTEGRYPLEIELAPSTIGCQLSCYSRGFLLGASDGHRKRRVFLE